MVAKKDFNAPRHPDLETVPNLQVIKALQSLKSRGYVTEQFAWKHFYWYLTNEGITYLRDYLNLPPEIVPATLRRQARTDGVRSARPKESSRPSGPAPDTADREAYRRGPGDEPKGGAGANFNPEFRGGAGGGGRGGGGFGRGRGGFGAPTS